MYKLIDGLAACAALAAWLAGTAGAQPLPPAGLPDLPYTSVFTRYQGFADQPVVRWGADLAPAGAGHGHHPSAAVPAPALPGNASPGAAPAPSPANHGGHGDHASPADHSGHGQHGSKP